MEFLQDLPVWALACVIFGLRVCDVSLGTVRTLAVVQGRAALSVALGFVEVLVWILAISQVMASLHESPLLMLAYAGGFAAGNAAGIALERWLALGTSVIRVISSDSGSEMARRLRAEGLRVTTFVGEGRDGPRTLLYAACARRFAGRVLAVVHEVDPTAVYVVERASESSLTQPLPHATGWRARLKMK